MHFSACFSLLSSQLKGIIPTLLFSFNILISSSFFLREDEDGVCGVWFYEAACVCVCLTESFSIPFRRLWFHWVNEEAKIVCGEMVQRHWVKESSSWLRTMVLIREWFREILWLTSTKDHILGPFFPPYDNFLDSHLQNWLFGFGTNIPMNSKINRSILSWVYTGKSLRWIF